MSISGRGPSYCTVNESHETSPSVIESMVAYSSAQFLNRVVPPSPAAQVLRMVSKSSIFDFDISVHRKRRSASSNSSHEQNGVHELSVVSLGSKALTEEVSILITWCCYNNSVTGRPF